MNNDKKSVSLARNVFKGFLITLVTILGMIIIIENIIILLKNESFAYNARRTSQNNSVENYYNEYQNEIAKMISDVNESVVGISYINMNVEDLLKVNSAEEMGLGSGVIVSSKGYIVTNQHIAQSVGSTVNVTLHDGEKIQGKVIWNEETIDLAIIKIKARNLKAIKLRGFRKYFCG